VSKAFLLRGQFSSSGRQEQVEEMFILFRASEVKVAQSVHTVSSMRTYTHTYVYTKSTLFLHKIIEGGTWYHTQVAV